MSTRSMVTSNPVFKQRKASITGKHVGPPSKAEKQFIGQLVADNGGVLTKRQVKAAAELLQRQPRMIRKHIERARREFNGRALKYVDLHMKAVEDGINTGDPKGIEAGMKGAQWAIERISHEGARIVDKEANQPSGTRVMVGIQIGGLIGSASKKALKSARLEGGTPSEGGSHIEAEIVEEGRS